MKNKSIYIVISFILFAKFISAQPAGNLDSTFNQTGIYTYDFGFHDNLNDVKIQQDQKIVGTGVALSTGFTGELKVIRLNIDGTPDSTFANNGIFSFLITNETYGFESSIKPDNKIIVSGHASVTPGYFDMLLLRLNENGTLDSTFGTNGSTVSDFSPRDDYAQAMTQQSDGKILISGTITDTVTYFSVPSIIRFTENGFIDSTFGTNGIIQIPVVEGDNELTSVHVQTDGKILAAGHYSNMLMGFNDFDIILVRVDSNGVLDSTFGNGGIVKTSINGGVDDSFGMEIDSAGNIFVAGFTTLPSLDLNMILLKYQNDGSLDTAFGTSGIVTDTNYIISYANDLKIMQDGKIVVGGATGAAAFGSQSMTVWRYLPDGNPDITFGTNGFVTTDVDTNFQEITSIDLQANAKIVAVGKFNNGSQNDIAVLRYINDFSNSVNEIKIENDLHVGPNPVSAGEIINILFSQTIESKMKVEMVDMMGRKITSVTEKTGENNFQIQIPESLKSGVYFLIVSDNKFQIKQKLIVL